MYALRKLASHDRLQQVPIDPMHLIKNIVGHCIGLIVGYEDSVKVREEEKHRQRFRTSWIADGDDELPPAPFHLTEEEIVLANDRAKRVYVPHGFDWRPRDIFRTGFGMKSHEWKQIACNGILKFCLRGMLGKKQRITLFKLFDVLSKLCAEVIYQHSLDELEEEVHEVLVLIERDFPVSLQVIVFHLLHHLPTYIRKFGPVYSFWMFSFERFNSWLTRRALNRRYPEATITETYRLTEWANVMELSGQLTAGILSDVQSDSSGYSVSQVISLSDDMVKCVEDYYHTKFPQPTPHVQPQAIRLKHFTHADCHGRAIRLHSAESEPEHSFSRSSYVSMNPSRVGRIMVLFQHNFLSTLTAFAYISWLDGPYFEPECKLHYCFATVQEQSVVPVSVLSNPLVVAYDDEEINKLWFLNI